MILNSSNELTFSGRFEIEIGGQFKSSVEMNSIEGHGKLCNEPIDSPSSHEECLIERHKRIRTVIIANFRPFTLSTFLP